MDILKIPANPSLKCAIVCTSDPKFLEVPAGKVDHHIYVLAVPTVQPSRNGEVVEMDYLGFRWGYELKEKQPAQANGGWYHQIHVANLYPMELLQNILEIGEK